MCSLDDFLAGSLAGCASRTLTAPAERLKTELQLHTGRRLSAATLSRKILAVSGARGFFQGNLTNCIKVAPQTALFFGSLEYFRGAVPNWLGETSTCRGIQSFCAGTSAGLFSQLCVYPLETVKTCLTVAPPGQYKGILDCAWKLVRDAGMRGLFRGVSPTLLTCIPFRGTQLLVYDALRDACAEYDLDHGPPGTSAFAGGLISTSIALTVAHPLTVVSTRMRVQGSSPERPVVYRNVLDCFRKLVKHEGSRGLMRGIGPNLGKVVPAAAINFAFYEAARDYIGNCRDCAAK